VALVGEGRGPTLFGLGLIGAVLIALALAGIGIAWNLRPTGPVGPRGNPAAAFEPDSYPPEALRRGEQGRIVAVLSIDRGGGVTNCRVVSSSESAALDQETCRLALRKMHFKPARDVDGNRIPSKYTLPVRWVLPE